MNNEMKVFWTNRAKISYYKNIEYLAEEWGNRVIQNFINDVDKTINTIVNNNEVGLVLAENINYRKYQITRQIALIYKVEKGVLLIVMFWNGKQNPKKLDRILRS